MKKRFLLIVSIAKNIDRKKMLFEICYKYFIVAEAAENQKSGFYRKENVIGIIKPSNT